MICKFIKHCFFILAFGFITNVNAQSVQVIDGAIQAPFSVSPTKQVYFSQGNLQYRPSTKTWRFAEHQYDIRLYNSIEVNASYNNWFDKFGFATSGWFTENRTYKPYLRSSRPDDYYIEESSDNDMVGEYANADWGVYNAISNGGNKAGMWRTLTVEEWEYLLVERPLADELCKYVMLDGAHVGICILPDNYFDVYDPTFKFSPREITYRDRYNNIMSYSVDADISMDDWIALETKGAVFLWLHFSTSKPEYNTMYWTATHGTAVDIADMIRFYKEERYKRGEVYRREEHWVSFNYVRLVQDINN